MKNINQELDDQLYLLISRNIKSGFSWKLDIRLYLQLGEQFEGQLEAHLYEPLRCNN